MDLFERVVRFEIELWNAVSRRLAGDGEVPPGTLLVLRILDRHEGRGRVQDVSTALGITAGAASKLVDRLERDALVQRTPNPDDRRSSLLDLSETGRAALLSGSAVAEATVAGLFDDDQRQRLEAVLVGASSALPTGSGADR